MPVKYTENRKNLEVSNVLSWILKANPNFLIKAQSTYQEEMLQPP
jgi:hypothetical protein